MGDCRVLFHSVRYQVLLVDAIFVGVTVPPYAVESLVDNGDARHATPAPPIRRRP